MQGKWHVALSTTVVLSLLIGSVPAGARQTGERVGNVKIEAKKGLAIETNSTSQKQSELVIIQFDGPVRDEWQEELEDRGVVFGDYIPDFSFIAKLDKDSDHKKLEKLSFIKKIVPFEPVSKVAPELRASLGEKDSVDVAIIGFDRTVNMSRTVTRMAVRGGVQNVRDAEDSPHISMAKLSGESLENVIESDDVIAVVPVPKNQLHNDVAATILHSHELASTGYTGEGQIVGIADTGLDTGDEATMHPDFQGQILSLYAIGRKGNASDPHGHGTHVAGSIVGTGKASDGQIKGMAPGAKLVFHSIQDKYDRLVTDDLNGILTEAYEDGARIHSDSWGADDNGEYSLTSYLFDKFLWEHPDMTSLVAAGNVGDEGFGTVGSPATAKNVIAVGASENDRPDLGDESDNPDEVWEYSSRGLTADGRMKPDVVAPGSYILSTRSSLAPSRNFIQKYNNTYAYMSGTSMAAPILAGGVAQVRQFLNEQGVKNPSGALIKAILLSGADDLGEDIRTQGFGRANLQNAIQTSYMDMTNGMKTGDKASYVVKVTDDSKPLAITLAWTDYPGSLAAKRTLVNDLNLKVTTPSGQKLNGNDFFKKPYDDEVDNLNNVEQIWITDPQKGLYTVSVEGYNIPKGPQPYALATTGEWGRADQKQQTKTGSLSLSRKYSEFSIRTRYSGQIALSAEWVGDADINLFVYDSRDNLLGSTSGTDNPESLTIDVPKPGFYYIRIQLDDGKKANYKLHMEYPGK